MRPRSRGISITTAVAVVAAIGALQPNGESSATLPTITASASQPARGAPQELPAGGEADEVAATSSPSPCNPWQRVDISVDADASNFYPGAKPFVEASPVGTASLYWRQCFGADGLPYYEEAWAADDADGPEPPPPTVDDLVPGAYDEMRRQVPQPDPSLTAPPVEQGTLVNAPVWLAVVPPEPVSARAEAGAVWAEATGSLVGLTWDMGVAGTGADVVECVGAGTPWSPPGAGEDGLRPSPDCGFTFEVPSTPEHTGGGEAFHVTVTAHWEVRITGSDGRDVAGDPIDVSFEFDYQVFELQTVGSE